MYFSIKERTLGIFYNFTIYLAQFVLHVLSLFNAKIKLGVRGRKETFQKLKNAIQKNDKTLWFHCASLGEYEQGLPVFRALKSQFPTHKIVLTFFSPSGYEIRKNTDIADVVVYLPLDSKHNAKHFLNMVNPELTIFVKYDIWPNYLKEVKKRNLKAILISALFRKNQSFFKFYGKGMQEALFAFEHIFTQDNDSKELLESINYNSVTISGDTRFDRVYNQLKIDNTLDFVNTFKQNKLCVVAGSTWPEDENLLIDFINNHQNDNVKFIIAPHNIKSNQISKLKSSLNKKTILFSEKDSNDLSQYHVLIIDTIGLLSKIYSYANIAYVGGAIGNTGLHNTLEPAVFGVPIIIGNHYEKFPEAKSMIKNQGMFSISNQGELNIILSDLITNQTKREHSGRLNFAYIKKNKGAVIQIIDFLRK
ncbi:glycosyltransferase N-terminal domain-containing protein [Corallibacter vietnamensis]|uniref:3-deoxy-D-manno-octulosonic acid transferase n=1 Tax=Corallibacter vietnamensis TaxID=904130 RepID=A0ABP7H2N7_9FLAO